MNNYHEKAQKFIKSSKDNGYSVKAEGPELIAYPPKNTKSKVMDVLKKAKDAVVEKTADVLSLPQRVVSKVRMAESDAKFNNLKQLSALKAMDKAGVADKGDESDPLFRYRVNKANK